VSDAIERHDRGALVMLARAYDDVLREVRARSNISSTAQ
jgi:hypothetical protein